MGANRNCIFACKGGSPALIILLILVLKGWYKGIIMHL
jgi:hypothetical protein